MGERAFLCLPSDGSILGSFLEKIVVSTSTDQKWFFPLPLLKSLAFAAVVALALALGIYSLRYALPHIPHPAPLPNFFTHRKALISHAIFASIALLAGPWQFIPALRRKHLSLHRWTGKIYLTAIAVGYVFSLPVALGAKGGIISTLGFLALGVIWIFTSGMGLYAILQRRVAAHQDWMTRSYAITFGAVTLRVYIAVAALLHLPTIPAYRAISWLSWITTLLFAEVLIRLRHRAAEPPQSSVMLPVAPIPSPKQT